MAAAQQLPLAQLSVSSKAQQEMPRAEHRRQPAQRAPGAQLPEQQDGHGPLAVFAQHGDICRARVNAWDKVVVAAPT